MSINSDSKEFPPMQIQKLRCFACSFLLMALLGPELITVDRKCPSCGLLNKFRDSDYAEPQPPLPDSAFAWACPDRVRVVGSAS
jgi:phage FluMu protein Com